MTLPPLTFTYRNHRGETATRMVIPTSVRYGTSPWHKEAQWLLLAYDLEKGADREFAMKDIITPDPRVEEACEIMKAMEQDIARLSRVPDREAVARELARRELPLIGWDGLLNYERDRWLRRADDAIAAMQEPKA